MRVERKVLLLLLLSFKRLFHIGIRRHLYVTEQDLKSVIKIHRQSPIFPLVAKKHTLANYMQIYTHRGEQIVELKFCSVFSLKVLSASMK